MLFKSVIIRSNTRIRLEFTSALDSTAFLDTSGTILVESQDGIGVSPDVQQRIPILFNPVSMELALSVTLAEGGQYKVSIDSIPGQDASFATGEVLFRVGESFSVPNKEIDIVDVESFLYNIDLVWTGTDYLEAPNGDLATISGLANVDGALRRRLVCEGLTWDSDYGVGVRNFVDAPTPSIFTLRGEILRQMLKDNRVSEATVRLETPENSIEEADYFVDCKLTGSSNQNGISIQVPANK